MSLQQDQELILEYKQRVYFYELKCSEVENKILTLQAENEQFKKVADEKEEMILELSNKRKWLVERCQEKDIQTEKLYKTIDTLHKVIKEKELSTQPIDNALFIQLETQIKNTTETQKTNEKLTLTLNEKEIDIKFLRKELVKLENK